MDYRKKGQKPHHSPAKRLFGMVVSSCMLISSVLASLPISAYYVEPEKEEEQVDVGQISKVIAPTTSITGTLNLQEEPEEQDDPNDVDPFSYLRFDSYYQNPDDTLKAPSTDIILEYIDNLEYSMPFTTHFDRDYSKLTAMDLLILKKIVVSEIGNCTFEQQAATAAMCLNIIYDDTFPDTMFENAIAPGRFRECYGYAPWPKASEKTELAISLALSGIDFSCNAVSFYTPEYSSDEGCKFFEEATTTTAVIPSKCEGETSVFACLNNNKTEALNATRYIYSKYYGKVVTYYG